jgi:hypothetical protein
MTAPDTGPRPSCAFPGCGHADESHWEVGEPEGKRKGCAILRCRCTAWTVPAPLTAEEYRLVLEVVREAIGIPHPATAGAAEKHAEVLSVRAIAAVVLLQAVLDGEAGDVARSAAWCREELARHPAAGYRTWNEAVAGRHAAEAARNQQETTEGGTS